MSQCPVTQQFFKSLQNIPIIQLHLQVDSDEEGARLPSRQPGPLRRRLLRARHARRQPPPPSHGPGQLPHIFIFVCIVFLTFCICTYPHILYLSETFLFSAACRDLEEDLPKAGPGHAGQPQPVPAQVHHCPVEPVPPQYSGSLGLLRDTYKTLPGFIVNTSVQKGPITKGQPLQKQLVMAESQTRGANAPKMTRISIKRIFASGPINHA